MKGRVDMHRGTSPPCVEAHPPEDAMPPARKILSYTNETDVANGRYEIDGEDKLSAESWNREITNSESMCTAEMKEPAVENAWN